MSKKYLNSIAVGEVSFPIPTASDDGKVLKYNNATKKIEFSLLSQNNSAISYIQIADIKRTRLNGGTFTRGKWLTRELNTIITDTANIVTLTNNQFTLPAGTYYCNIRCPAYRVNSHRARLYNITDNNMTLLGRQGYSVQGNYMETISEIAGMFTINKTINFEVQHFGQITIEENGFGMACGIGEYEIYTVVEVWKVS